MVSLLAPVCKAFETIYDLILAVVCGNNADGHLSYLIRGLLRGPGPQEGIAGAQLPGRQKAEVACGPVRL
jgi:hypothetical protein